MIFKEENKTFYCKGEYHETFYELDCLNSQYYYKGYLIHRLDGLAIICTDEYEEWYFEGKKHREGGPAIEWNDGTKIWFLNGTSYSEKSIGIL